MRSTRSRSKARKSITDTLFETNYQTKVASELWLNLDGKEYRLVGKVVRLGRALDNDIVLEDRSCSRYHAVIHIQDNEVKLEDLKSRNGVQVNGEKITQASLVSEDEILIGDLAGIFYERSRDKPGAHREITSAGKSIIATSVSKIVERSLGSEDSKLSLLSKFRNLSKVQKLSLVAAIPFLFLGILYFYAQLQTKPLPANQQVSDELVVIKPDQIVAGEVNPESLEKCVEYEDLGNYRKARKCLLQLTPTIEVASILNRVAKQQHELSAKRFQEGKAAFDNFYYDLAIIKLQEVLLIADDYSEFRQKADELILKAEERKSQR